MTRHRRRFTLTTILIMGAACAPGGSSPPASPPPGVGGSAPVTGTAGGGAAGASGGPTAGSGAVAGSGAAGAGAGAPAPMAGTPGVVMPPAPPPAPGNCSLPAGLSTYNSPSYATNAAAELAIRDTFNGFMLPMRTAGADITTRPTAVQLKGLFDSGNPSLRSITLPYHAARFDELFALFEASAGRMFRPTEPPPATGGQLVINIYSREGLDIRQAIEKTMYAATFYHHAVRLMSGPITPATIDRIVAIFGAHPTFGADPTNAANQDIWGAAYVSRRTNPRAPAPGGFYTQIKSNLIVAQAAAAAGAACAAQLQDALRIIRENWEKALLATSLNYANDVKSKLAQVMVEPALHALAEGAGFARGFLMLPAAERKITDTQLEEILTLFGQPSSGPATVYKFVTESAAQLPKLDMIIQKIKAVYGFSDAEVETYKMTFGSAG